MKAHLSKPKTLIFLLIFAYEATKRLLTDWRIGGLANKAAFYKQALYAALNAAFQTCIGGNYRQVYFVI